MAHYLKDASKWVYEERSNLGKGKSEWYSHHRRQNKRGEERGRQNKCVELKFDFLHSKKCKLLTK